MPLFSILVILAVAASLGFCAITTWRVFQYNRKYKFPESKYSKLFGIISKEHITAIYLISTVSYSVAALWFIFTL